MGNENRRNQQRRKKWGTGEKIKMVWNHLCSVSTYLSCFYCKSLTRLWVETTWLVGFFKVTMNRTNWHLLYWLSLTRKSLTGSAESWSMRTDITFLCRLDDLLTRKVCRRGTDIQSEYTVIYWQLCCGDICIVTAAEGNPKTEIWMSKKIEWSFKKTNKYYSNRKSV